MLNDLGFMVYEGWYYWMIFKDDWSIYMYIYIESNRKKMDDGVKESEKVGEYPPFNR